VLVGAGAALLLSACGGTTKGKELDITLAGTVHKHITSYSGTPRCSWYANDMGAAGAYVYSVQFPISVNGQPGEFSVLINDAHKNGGPYSVANENVAIDGPDASHLHWSTVGGAVPGSGTVTIRADRSGTITGVLPARAGGAALNGDGTKLKIRGSWHCTHWASQ
jgi:hypothetical protein